MRELERDTPETTAATLPEPKRLTVVGSGRLGGSLARAATDAGFEVRLAGRDDAGVLCAGADLVLLCVPDAEIAAACGTAASAEPPPRLVGHTSGATTLDALEPAAVAGIATFSLHPLLTFADRETSPQGAPCAIAGSNAKAIAAATALAGRLGMRPFEVPEEGRAAYHAAASIASNFLVALEESAAGLLEKAGVEDARELLAPLVLRTAANWSERGAAALTGPIARGDEATIERQRAAIEALAPELSAIYEALAERTRAIVEAKR
ncbi:MAG: DUF2520 domain-containing protein [Solirubrobacterales bacterium]